MVSMPPMDRIKKAHIAIMRNLDFCTYSGLLSCGKVDVTTDMPCKTACTDGWNVDYHPDFIATLNDAELRFVVLHEATHKAYQHLHVWKPLAKEDMRLANVAMDHFVNLALMDADAGKGFLAMPEVGIQPNPKYRGWNVQRIYDDLKQNQQKKDGDKKGDGKGGPGDGNPGDGNPGDGNEGMDGHDWENANKGDDKTAAKQGEEIQRALRQGEIIRRKLAGKGSNNASGVFGDLLNPKVDWRKVLREFVMEFCRGRDESSWARPNRRFLSDDIYMPSMVGVTMQELVIGFDTSGSCFGTEEMTRFVTEVTAIIEMVCPTKTHVLYCDTQVVGYQVFEEGQFAVQNLQPQGGGGTDLTCIFDWVKKQNVTPQACIVLTDGYTPFGEPPSYPVLWAITSDVQAPYGTTLTIKD